jgi:hypothetical protein
VQDGIGISFHWRLSQGGEKPNASRALNQSSPETGLPDLESQIEFCRAAEGCGIDSLLVAFGYYMPDPIMLSAALGLATERIKFMIAYRSGVASPVLFVQQLNTLSALIRGRFSLNIVAGHSPDEQRSYGDFLAHDERYARTDELAPALPMSSSRGGKPTFPTCTILSTSFHSICPNGAGLQNTAIKLQASSRVLLRSHGRRRSDSNIRLNPQRAARTHVRVHELERPGAVGLYRRRIAQRC